MNKLKRWELALLMALCVTLCTAAWAQNEQAQLAGELVRLHVIANSDSLEDQAAKLQMRDKVLAVLSPALQNCENRDDAVNIIYSCLPRLEALGDVSVTLREEYYPARDYATFSLPAGRYLSLQVTMGAGAGENWWCVVFPPLCTEALAEEDTDAFLALDDSQLSLITQDTEGYDLRFRVVDWWGQLTAALGKEN